MNMPEPLRRINEIAFELTHGNTSLGRLKCPYCGGQLVFSFTRIQERRFGLFIDCKDCHRRHHFNLSEKPPNFQENLVYKEYQDLEDMISGLDKNTKDEPAG